MSARPIEYRDDLETELPDEDQLIDDVIATMRQLMEKTFEVGRHAVKGTHAKTHGVVTGSLTVHDGLPAELAQGLFARPATHKVIMRYASEPGQVDPDTVRRARGLSLKVLDVDGEMMRPDWTSQDFLFNTWPIIPQGDVKTYLDLQKARLEHFGHNLRIGLAHALRHPTPKQTLLDRTPNIHPVAHSYYSQSAFRYGDHVAKSAMIPVSDAQWAVRDQEVGDDDEPGVLKDWVRDFYASHGGRYDLRVQLCTGLKEMPIKDAAVRWNEETSPYRAVATVDVPPQDSFDPGLRVFAEDVMSWRPWYGLVAHRPLGSINRLRRKTYESLGEWRRQVNAVAESNPVRLADVPSS